MPPRKRRTAQDWTDAALEALAEGGLAAVAVEPLAARLGATKGSFYWHFSDRNALITATLAAWEQLGTEDVITWVDQSTDPAQRLERLFVAAVGDHDRSTGARIELALQANAGHPLVAPVLDRVTRRRLDYVTGLFTALGYGPEVAHARALTAYTAYLGHAQLLHATPDLAPSDPDLPRYAQRLVRMLTADR